MKYNSFRLYKLIDLTAKLPTVSILFSAAVTIMLGGCATIQKSPDSNLANQVSAEYVAKANNPWMLLGKISYRDGKNTAIVNLDWQHLGDGYDTIRIFNSLGGDVARIEQKDGTSKVRIKGKDIVNPTNMAEAIADEVGYYIPLEQLQFWLKGEPAPDSEAQTSYADGDASRIVQDGWQIDYSSFKQGLARRITAKKSPHTITLAITSWQKN